MTRSRTGRIIDRSIDGIDSDPTANNFRYDTIGRLTQAHVNGDTYTYAFAATGGCGAAPTAGKNANRTSISINATDRSVVLLRHRRPTHLSDINGGTVR